MWRERLRGVALQPMAGYLLLLSLALMVHSRSVAAQNGEPTTYQVGDLYLPGSRVYTHVFKTGLGHEHAIIGLVKSGRLDLRGGEADLGTLVFDIRSFVADTETARKYIGLEGTTDESTQRQVTANMLSADVLDAQRYPTATFKVSKIEFTEEGGAASPRRARISGDFTLHGVTRPIVVGAKIAEENTWWHVTGEFEILQTQFGIRPYRKAFGAVGVADRLVIVGDFYVARQPISTAQAQ